MPYTPDKPPLPETTDELRARIPGWGADLDPANRPSFPRERFDPSASGAHWSFPERQPEHYKREKSVEHLQMTPVFGTSCPPKGLSGVIRRVSYERFSEGRAAHWLLLLAADRVDAIEGHLRSFVTLRPDNPITQTGVKSEFTHHGVRSRVGKHRADVKHQPLDVVIVGAPWMLGAYAAVRVVRKVRQSVG